MSIVNLMLVSKRFGQVIEDDKVSSNINGGELSGLLDLDGAGKATILHLVLDIFKRLHSEIAIPAFDVIFVSAVQESTKSQ